ncbi:VOC family protein [Streptomyces marokkonensis]|uniref:VOC family protein n=1 Tax=Streptomyces marokkonensis TaxID=324855 RepID=A0ABP7S1Q0_9ACTN
MSIIRPANFYHFGIAVEDLEASSREITSITGSRWIEPLEFEQLTRFNGVDREMRFTVTYSLEAPHHELIQVAPGTPFESPSREGTVHHLGYWTEDFKGDLKRMRELGYQEEVVGLDEHREPWGFAYFVTRSGRRIEIADRSTFEPTWDEFLLKYAAGDK